MEFSFLIRFHNNAQRWKYVISTIFVWLVFAQSFLKFHKSGDIRKLKACERMISVDYIMNALEHSKVRLPFFLYTLYRGLTAGRLIYRESTTGRLIYRGLTARRLTCRVATARGLMYRGLAARRLIYRGLTVKRLIYRGLTARRLMYTGSTARRVVYREVTARKLIYRG